MHDECPGSPVLICTACLMSGMKFVFSRRLRTEEQGQRDRRGRGGGSVRPAVTRYSVFLHRVPLIVTDANRIQNLKSTEFFITKIFI